MKTIEKQICLDLLRPTHKKAVEHIDKLWSWKEYMDFSSIKGNRLCVSCIDENIVGVIAFNIDSCSFLTIITINNIVVEKSFRRLGVGTHMINQIISESISSESFVDDFYVKSIIKEDNLPAQMFFKSLEFKGRTHKNETYLFERCFLK